MDAVRELIRALKNSTAQDHVIGPFIVQHGSAVARELAVDREELTDLDESIPADRGRLISLVERAHARRKWEREAARLQRLELAVVDLQSSARMSHGAVHLSVAALFRLSAAARGRLLRLEFGAGHVHVQRALLQKARRALRFRGDVWLFLDERGLHLRWRGGRGGLDLRAPAPGWREQPALAVRLDPPRALQPAQLGEVLRELGFSMKAPSAP